MKNSSFLFFSSGIFLGIAGAGSHINLEFLFAFLPTALFAAIGMAVAESEGR